jgi:hypothetical protein
MATDTIMRVATPEAPQEPEAPLVETRRGAGREILATMERTRAAAGEPQLNPLLSTTMVGNGLMANQANEKRLAKKAAEADQKQSITFNGDGTVSITGAPAADFMETARTQSAGTLAGVYATLERLGMAPSKKPDDPSLDDDVTEEELVEAGMTLRGWDRSRSVKEARRAMKDPLIKKRAGEWIRTHYRKDLGDRYGDAQPILNDEEQRQTRARQETVETRRNFESYLSNDLLHLGSAEKAVEVGKQRVEAAGGRWNESMADEIRSSFTGQREKALGDRAKTVSTRLNSIRDEDVRGYKPTDRETFIANIEEEIGGLTAAERIRFGKRFDGLQQEIATQQRQQARAEERLSMAIDRFSRSTAEKPMTLAIGDAKVLPADQLIQWVGDPKVNQQQLVMTMRRRAAEMAPESDGYKDIQQTTGETVALIERIRLTAGLERSQLRDAAAVTAAIEAGKINKGDAEQLARGLEKIKSLADREKAMQAEHRKLRDKLLVIDGRGVEYRPPGAPATSTSAAPAQKPAASAPAAKPTPRTTAPAAKPGAQTMSAADATAAVLQRIVSGISSARKRAEIRTPNAEDVGYRASRPAIAAVERTGRRAAAAYDRTRKKTALRTPNAEDIGYRITRR